MRRLLKLYVSGGLVAAAAAACVFVLPFSAGATVRAGSDIGTVTYADYSDATDWDPAIAFSTESIFLPNVYEPLVWYRNGKTVPGLATSWKATNGGKTWVFKLRHGVTFHDGAPMNAAAVKFSVDRTKKIAKGASYVWAAVKSIDVVDPYTVRFNLKYSAALDLIASGQYGAWIYSPKSGAQGTPWFQQGHDAGSGPYQVTGWDKGQQITLEKFDGYWKGWNGAHPSKVVIRIVTEASTRVQMLKRGDAQFAAVIPTDALPALRKDKSIAILQSPGWTNRMWLLNTQKGPTADKRVRQALEYAFDRQTVAKQIFEGAATVANSAIPASMWGSLHSSPYRFDLNKAKELLASAGYGPDKRLKLTGRYIAGIESMQNEMLLFQSNLKKIGVDLELDPGPWPAIWAKAKVESTAPNVQSMTWWPTYPTPNDWLVGLFHSESPTVFNLSHYANPKYDALVDKGVKLEGPNRAAAIKAYQQAQKVLLDDAAAIFSVDVLNGMVMRKSVGGYARNPAYETVFFYDLNQK
jgi:peptide/nickel transport system substrate-binding protein